MGNGWRLPDIFSLTENGRQTMETHRRFSPERKKTNNRNSETVFLRIKKRHFLSMSGSRLNLPARVTFVIFRPVSSLSWTNKIEGFLLVFIKNHRCLFCRAFSKFTILCQVLWPSKHMYNNIE